MLKAYAVPDGAATTHGTVQQRRRGTVQQRRTDGAAHAHDAAITHDAETTRARRGTMCMLLLGVVLLAVAINTCTYYVWGLRSHYIQKLICLILGRLVEALRGMPSTLLGRTAQRNSATLNRCKGCSDIFSFDRVS